MSEMKYAQIDIRSDRNKLSELRSKLFDISSEFRDGGDYQLLTSKGDVFYVKYQLKSREDNEAVLLLGFRRENGYEVLRDVNELLEKTGVEVGDFKTNG